ncbi:type 2 periplasmic-binding domain-containing protein [Martelella soudanensis]|uniref:hypothetical protein n=1 Tax=unclassified Martelella TaxID=2629616 RepID=UPI0015DE3A40|nr:MULTISPECIES: hypothetical protein [unclassified Martelella]
MELNGIIRSGMVAASAAAFVLAGALPGRAETIDLAGRTVTLVHNVSPGGATAISAQVLADAWSKAIAGHPTMVVQSVSGGALTKGIDYVMDARPDGRTLGYLAWQGTTRILDPEALQIPFEDFGVIGGIGGSNFLVHVRSDVGGGLENRDDFANLDNITIGVYSPRMTQGMQTAAALDLLGVDWQFVSGMLGDGPLYAALQRGEIDGYPATTTQYIAELADGPIAGGDTMAIWQMGPLEADGSMKRDPALEGVPTVKEYIEKATGKAPDGPLWELIQYHARSSASVNWIVVAPPGTPEDHLEMLRASFDEATASPEYMAAATKVYGSPPNIVHWQEMSDIIAEVQNTSEDIKTTMRGLVDRIEQ